MTFFRPLILCSVLLAAGPATAKPGDAKVEEPDKESNDVRVELFENNKADTICKLKGKVCLRASSGTEAEGSEAVASPIFKRRAEAKGDWVVDLYGVFKTPALAGNAQFIFSDIQESKESKARVVTALYQVSIKAGGSVSTRVRLSPDEGFRAKRNYRAQVVQLINGKEVILAEGDFQLH